MTTSSSPSPVSSSSPSAVSSGSGSSSTPAGALRRAAILFWGAVGAVVGAVVGFLVLGVVGLIIGALVTGAGLAGIGALLVARFVESALDSVLAGVRAEEADAAHSPRLFNLLQGLCATSGVVAPRVSVSNDPGINALVAADPSRHRSAELVVTRGFVDDLERIEMEGAVALCLARLRSGLAESQTLAVALAIDSPWFIPPSARRAVIGGAGTGQSVFDADLKGVGITRYPPGLAGAFQRMLSVSTVVEGVDPRTNLLWIADPAGESDVSSDPASNSAADGNGGSRVDGSSEERPPLTERLALLREI